jgi:hypothetical protein
MIPMELMSMLGSTVLGGVMSIMAQKAQATAEKEKMLMQRAEFAGKQTDKAREVKDPHTMHTRRWIALMCVFSIIVVPITAPIFVDIPVYMGYTETVSQGFWIFSSDYDVTKWKPMTGIVIGPLQSHTIFSIIGLYFGGSLTRK